MEQQRKTKLGLIFFAAFLIGLAEASLLYVLSSYFAEVIESDQVGAFYLIAYSATLISLFFLQKILRLFDRTQILKVSLAAIILISIFLSWIPVSHTGAIVLVLLLVLTAIVWVIIDIIIEESTLNNQTGKIRGKYLTILATGVLFGPIISTQVKEIFGFEGIFRILAIGIFLSLCIILIFLKNNNRSTVIESKILLTRRQFNRIYFISFALDFFFAVMTIYMPIYLREIGFTWSEIGIIFTIALLPIVLLPYPIGYFADKYRNFEKYSLIIFLIITGASTIVIGYSSSDSAVFWATLLAIARIGASGLEILKDSFLYRRIDGTNIKEITYFRTSKPITHIAAAIILTPALLLFPVQSVFIISGIILFIGMISAFKLCKYSQTINPDLALKKN
jgi:MFS family permease